MEDCIHNPEFWRLPLNPAEETSSVLAIPKNIELAFGTNIKEILFDSLVINSVKGNIETSGGIATLKNLSMDMLNGNLIMNGAYNTANPAKPSADLNLRVTDIDIHSAYNAFSFIKQSLPIAMNCNGKISATMKFSSDLDTEMSPIMTTANGGGSLSTKGFARVRSSSPVTCTARASFRPWTCCPACRV